MFIMPQQTRRSPRVYRRNADINMTNLMDVMMVLLVVFMVAAPLMTSGRSPDATLDASCVSNASLLTHSKSIVVFVRFISSSKIGVDS